MPLHPWDWWSENSNEHIDGLAQDAVTPLLMHWSYCSLALSHWYVLCFPGHEIVVRIWYIYQGSTIACPMTLWLWENKHVIERKQWVSKLPNFLDLCWSNGCYRINMLWNVISHIEWSQYVSCWWPVASFTKEVNPRLDKRPLKINRRLANRRLTSLVKEATGVYVASGILQQSSWPMRLAYGEIQCRSFYLSEDSTKLAPCHVLNDDSNISHPFCQYLICISIWITLEGFPGCTITT